MSRIGKAPVKLPAGVTVTVDKSNVVTVKGSKGQLSQQVDPDLGITIEDGTVTVTRPTEQKRHRAMHGLYRTLINNMVTGVSQGFKKEMEIIGVGYKAEANGQVLELSLGYSHPVIVVLPKEISVSAETQKGRAPKVTLESVDKQLVGHFAAKVRSLRAPEPYKGKGIRYVGEDVRRKAGKAAAKK
ncbi:MAG: 50S ribosomal protein L6 [Bacteroidia bacterium]|nr:50S ribosomal protein L6 [Bacteroidia bacterium]